MKNKGKGILGKREQRLEGHAWHDMVGWQGEHEP